MPDRCRSTELSSTGDSLARSGVRGTQGKAIRSIVRASVSSFVSTHPDAGPPKLVHVLIVMISAPLWNAFGHLSPAIGPH